MCHHVNQNIRQLRATVYEHSALIVISYSCLRVSKRPNLLEHCLPDTENRVDPRVQNIQCKDSVQPESYNKLLGL